MPAHFITFYKFMEKKMRNSLLKLAVLSALGFAAANAVAAPGVAGFTNLPAAGFATTGGTTAYTECNTTGNYGSVNHTTQTATANQGCALFLANVNTAPVSGFTLVASAARPVVMNNTYTGGANVTVGTLTDRVWRNAAKTECIYDAKFVSANIDYNTTLTGTQYFELNDFARAGFSGRPVDVAYYTPTSTSEAPVFRIGLSFSAVQHRANTTTPANAAAGYVSLPLTTPAFAGSINGLNSWPLAVPTAAQQSASINANWVDFTTDVGYLDDDATASLYRNSSVMYVKSTCTSAAPVAVANALRLRQTAQENTSFIEIAVTGYAPPSAVATPAPVNPF